MKTIISIIVATLFGLNITAFNASDFSSYKLTDTVPENIIYNLDIEGVMMDSLMTKDQVIEKFGEPDKFSMKNSFLDTEAKYERYDYEKAMLLFIDEMLYAFSVSHSEWSVLNTYIEGGVRVGDNISKIASLKPEPANWLGEGVYYLCCYEDFNMIINTTSEGVITNINFSFRD